MEPTGKTRLAVIVPCFNEEDNLPETLSEILSALAEWQDSLEIRLVVVDDHSTDKTFALASDLDDARVSCLRLSRRSGSHTAIRAALELVPAEVYAVISADGQDDPAALPAMLETWREGAQIVWATRRGGEEHHPWQVRLPAMMFYWALARLRSRSDKSLGLNRADFFLLDRSVADAVNACPERGTSLFGLLIWLGFRQQAVQYDRRPRRRGSSKWRYMQRVRLAEEWIVNFTDLPVNLLWLLAAVCLGSGVVWALASSLYSLLTWQSSPWLWFFPLVLVLGGLHFSAMGLLGSMLKKSLEESKRRPFYFIEKRHGKGFIDQNGN